MDGLDGLDLGPNYDQNHHHENHDLVDGVDGNGVDDLLSQEDVSAAAEFLLSGAGMESDDGEEDDDGGLLMGGNDDFDQLISPSTMMITPMNSNNNETAPQFNNNNAFHPHQHNPHHQTPNTTNNPTSHRHPTGFSPTSHRLPTVIPPSSHHYGGPVSSSQNGAFHINSDIKRQQQFMTTTNSQLSQHHHANNHYSIHQHPHHAHHSQPLTSPGQRQQPMTTNTTSNTHIMPMPPTKSPEEDGELIVAINGEVSGGGQERTNGPRGGPQAAPTQDCVCKKCGKSFNSVWYLKQHAVKHSTERPFKCKFCHKTYRFRSNLYQHKCPDRDTYMSAKGYIKGTGGRGGRRKGSVSTSASGSTSSASGSPALPTSHPPSSSPSNSTNPFIGGIPPNQQYQHQQQHQQQNTTTSSLYFTHNITTPTSPSIITSPSSTTSAQKPDSASSKAAASNSYNHQKFNGGSSGHNNYDQNHQSHNNHHQQQQHHQSALEQQHQQPQYQQQQHHLHQQQHHNQSPNQQYNLPPAAAVNLPSPTFKPTTNSSPPTQSAASSYLLPTGHFPTTTINRRSPTTSTIPATSVQKYSPPTSTPTCPPLLNDGNQRITKDDQLLLSNRFEPVTGGDPDPLAFINTMMNDSNNKSLLPNYHCHPSQQRQESGMKQQHTQQQHLKPNPVPSPKQYPHHDNKKKDIMKTTTTPKSQTTNKTDSSIIRMEQPKTKRKRKSTTAAPASTIMAKELILPATTAASSHPATDGPSISSTPADQTNTTEKAAKTYTPPELTEAEIEAYMSKYRTKLHLCNKCDLYFPSREHLSRHMTSHNFIDSRTQCIHCSESFANERDYGVHKTRHAPDSPHCCSRCRGMFRSRLALKRHALHCVITTTGSTVPNHPLLPVSPIRKHSFIDEDQPFIKTTLSSTWSPATQPQPKSSSAAETSFLHLSLPPSSSSTTTKSNSSSSTTTTTNPSEPSGGFSLNDSGIGSSGNGSSTSNPSPSNSVELTTNINDVNNWSPRNHENSLHSSTTTTLMDAIVPLSPCSLVVNRVQIQYHRNPFHSSKLTVRQVPPSYNVEEDELQALTTDTLTNNSHDAAEQAHKFITNPSHWWTDFDTIHRSTIIDQCPDKLPEVVHFPFPTTTSLISGADNAQNRIGEAVPGAARASRSSDMKLKLKKMPMSVVSEIPDKPKNIPSLVDTEITSFIAVVGRTGGRKRVYGNSTRDNYYQSLRPKRKKVMSFIKSPDDTNCSRLILGQSTPKIDKILHQKQRMIRSQQAPNKMDKKLKTPQKEGLRKHSYHCPLETLHVKGAKAENAHDLWSCPCCIKRMKSQRLSRQHSTFHSPCDEHADNQHRQTHSDRNRNDRGP